MAGLMEKRFLYATVENDFLAVTCIDVNNALPRIRPEAFFVEGTNFDLPDS